jgi:hypothetical protein
VGRTQNNDPASLQGHRRCGRARPSNLTRLLSRLEKAQKQPFTGRALPPGRGLPWLISLIVLHHDNVVEDDDGIRAYPQNFPFA